jgi:hypothetical protein
MVTKMGRLHGATYIFLVKAAFLYCERAMTYIGKKHDSRNAYIY